MGKHIIKYMNENRTSPKHDGINLTVDYMGEKIDFELAYEPDYDGYSLKTEAIGEIEVDPVTDSLIFYLTELLTRFGKNDCKFIYEGALMHKKNRIEEMFRNGDLEGIEIHKEHLEGIKKQLEELSEIDDSDSDKE